jgi:ERO1-like protein alpha
MKVLLALLLPCLAIGQFGDSQKKSFFKKPELPLSDQCFCKLEGQIDDCSCKVDTVDHFNNAKIFPRLASLLAKDFFRYFYYQPYKRCPFWDPTSGKCASSLCQVKSCPTTDLPPGIAAEEAEAKREAGEAEAEVCEEAEQVDPPVDRSITKQELVSLSTWRQHDEAGSTYCDLDDASSCPDCVYVDLTKNPERFTGYSGAASRRVWASVYEENCFTPVGGTVTPPPAFSSAFGPAQLGEMCLEKRAFYRAVSGLHTSITIHLAANYPLEQRKTVGFLDAGAGETWGPNFELFHQRFDPDQTEGQGPYWLKNLYFVYLLELRALSKASDYLASQTYFTGREEEDKETVIAVKELLSLVSSFEDHYDETSMFTGGRQAEVRAFFRVIVWIELQTMSVIVASIKAFIHNNIFAGAEAGVPGSLQEHHARDGLCRLRQVQAVGQAAGDGLQ